MLLAEVSGKPPSSAFLASSDTLDCSIWALTRKSSSDSPTHTAIAIPTHFATRPAVMGLRGLPSRPPRRESRSSSKPGSPARPGPLNQRGRER